MITLRFSIILKNAFLLILLFPTLILAQGWQWQNPLPQGNTLSSIKYSNKNIIWSGALSGGFLLRSTDSGINWEIVVLPERMYVEDLFFINENIGWVCGSIETGGNVIGIVLGTLDGGKNWETQIDNFTNHFNTIVFADESNGWVSGETSIIYHTTNGGKDWEIQADLLGNINSLFAIDTFNVWAANTSSASGALFYTKDGGKNWLADSTINWAYDIQFVDSLYGWVAGRDNIARTTNGGLTWETKLDTFPFNWKDVSAVSKDYSWAITSTKTKIAVTTDGGNSWELRDNLDEYSLHAFSFYDSLNGLGVGYGGIIVKTIDGGNTWELITKRITDALLFEFFFIDDSTGWIVGDDGLILKTINGGEAWQSQNSQTQLRLIDIFFKDKLNGWAVGDNGIIIKTSDGGETWINQASPTSFLIQELDFTNYPTGFIVSGSSFSNGEIHKTTNGGLDWTLISSLTLPPGGYGIKFTSKDIGWIIIGGLSTSALQQVYKTKDEGETWDLIRTNYSDTAYYSWHFISNNTAWVSIFYPSSILHTTDGGVSWNQNPTPEAFKSLYFINSFIGWGASSGEIYMTTDGGISWMPQRVLSSNLKKVKFINNKNGYIIGSGGQILHTTTGGITAIKDPFKNSIVNEFTLYHNYPNPFNSETTINFYLPKETNSVSIYIFDILGRIVKEIKTSVHQGNNSIKWNGKDNYGSVVASGVYFYSVIYNGKSLQKKMIYLK